MDAKELGIKLANIAIEKVGAFTVELRKVSRAKVTISQK